MDSLSSRPESRAGPNPKPALRAEPLRSPPPGGHMPRPVPEIPNLSTDSTATISGHVVAICAHVCLISALVALVPVLGVNQAFAAPTALAPAPGDHAPDIVRAWAKARAGAVPLAATADYEEVLPFTGLKLHRVKAVAAGTGLPVSMVLDDLGQPVDDKLDSLRLAEAQARWQARGAILEKLWVRLNTANPGDQIPVVVWLRGGEPSLARASGTLDSVTEFAENVWRQVGQSAARGSFRNILKGLAVEPGSDLEGVPAHTLSLTPGQVRALAWNPAIAWMDLRKDPVPMSSTVWVDSVLAASGTTGYSGSGKGVCVMEYCLPNTPNNLQIQDVYNNLACAGSNHDLDRNHSRMSAGAIRSTASPAGTSPGADVDLANFLFDPTIAGAVSWCANSQYDPVISYSYGCDDSHCRGLMDYTSTHSPFPLVVVPSGSQLQYPRDTVTSGSYCALTVGGANNAGTAGRTDDTIGGNSGDLNLQKTAYGTVYTDWELPNLVAPEQDVCADGVSYCFNFGTSYSSAIAAGIAAQAMEAAGTNLTTWPEITRAILMVSANRDIDGGRLMLSDTTDERDGAGLVNAQLATQVAAPANQHNINSTSAATGYSGGYLSSSTTPNYNFYSGVYHAQTTASNKRLRAILSWDATAICTNPTNVSTAACDPSRLDADIDLYVYRHSDGQPMGYASVTASSNWEAVEFAADANTQYDIKIYVYNWNSPSTSTYYGIAWNFDDYTSSQ